MPRKIKEESDYEDRDQLEESGDELESFGPGSSTRASARDEAGGYQLKNVLKLPRATTYSTQAVYGEHRPFAPGATVAFIWHFRPDICWRYRPVPGISTR